MNLAGALIIQVLRSNDFDTWANVRKHYLPTEYHKIFEVIGKHTDTYHKLPTFDEIELGVRDEPTREKLYALQSLEVDADPHFLLEALKSEYIQREALSEMEKWVDSSIAFESAEEVIRHIQQLGVILETKVEITPDEESMQKISLFDTEEEMDARITLGFNEDFDTRFTFRPTDYIMMGGRRGAGKSITGSNIARNVITQLNKKVLYFSVEMPSREVLQRDAAIATGIYFSKIRDRNLSVDEWRKLAKWWSQRYIDGEDIYATYLKHNDFDKFHTIISKQPLVPAHLDIIYDPHLTLGRMNAEIDKRIALGEEIGLIVADYVQKVKRVGGSNYSINNMDWQEQVYVSNGFKTIAQDRCIPVYSPYQIDAEGEARFAKGILDSCDAAFTLEGHKGEFSAMTFKTTKMRGADDTEVFTSEMNWGNLIIGPKSIKLPDQDNTKKRKTTFNPNEMTIRTNNIYED